jgi:hypothetical protein
MRKLTAGLALATALAAGSAQSALLSFEDDDIDFAVRGGSVITTGTLTVGDILVSVFEIPVFRIDGANAIPAGQELNGVAAIQITSISPAGVITFGAVTGGLNSILALGNDPDAAVVGGGAGGGATIAMFLNSTTGGGGDRDLDLNRTTNPASNCVSIADCIDQASLGTLFQVDGFTGDPDEIWQSNAAGIGLDIGAVAGASNTLIVASFNAAQTTLFQAGGFQIGGINRFTGLPCVAGPGCVFGITLSGTITGGQGLSNGAFAHSDFDAQKLTVNVPEPGVLALLGAALFGFGALRRRS